MIKTKYQDALDKATGNNIVIGGLIQEELHHRNVISNIDKTIKELRISNGILNETLKLGETNEPLEESIKHVQNTDESVEASDVV